jgi:hypothetical protein
MVLQKSWREASILSVFSLIFFICFPVFTLEVGTMLASMTFTCDSKPCYQKFGIVVVSEVWIIWENSTPLPAIFHDR